jgi:hypothetical protein
LLGGGGLKHFLIKGLKTSKTTTEKTLATTIIKTMVNSTKVLDLFLWSPLLVLALMTGGFSMPSLLKVGIWAMEGKVLPLLSDSLEGSWLEGFFPHFPWSYGPSVTSRSSVVVSPDGWLVSSTWFLLPTRQVVIGTCSSSLPVCARWSDLLLFLPGGSCIPRQLQH